jgi:hypothetical protein
MRSSCRHPNVQSRHLKCCTIFGDKMHKGTSPYAGVVIWAVGGLSAGPTDLHGSVFALKMRPDLVEGVADIGLDHLVSGWAFSGDGFLGECKN